MATTIAEQEQPSSSESAGPSSKEREEVMAKALNIMGQGKRNLICGDIPMAVSQFEECCQILAETFGEMAFECAPAYFSYGHALLEIARMDSKVIESLEAEAAEDEDEDDDESEKSEGKSGGETPGTTEDEDRTDKSESLSSQDELTDKEAKTEIKSKETKADDSKADADSKTETKADADSKTETKADADSKTETKADADSKTETKADADSKTETKADADSKTEAKADADSKTETKADADSKTDAETKVDIESKADVEQSEKQKVKTEDKAKDEEADKDEESDDEHNAGTDVTNLQLAWESLELAKVIYLRRTDKESQLKGAQACLKLGEVGLETGIYDQAVEDIKQCLSIQQENLEPEEREIAESYYQLGLVHVFAGNHDPSIENFKKAVSVIEARIEKLKKVIESKKGSKNTDDIEIAYNAQTEIKELEEVIPDMKQKITDTLEEKNTVAELKLMAKKEAEEKLSEGPLPGPSGFDAMSRMSGLAAGHGTTSTGFGSADAGKSQQDVKTTDISHLIRRKRKPEPTEASAEKKQKSESGSSTGTESAKSKETDTSNGPLSSTQHTKAEPLSDTKTN